MKHSVKKSLAAFVPVLTGLALPMLLSSCSEEMGPEPENLSESKAKVQVLPKLRTPEEAVNIASTAWHLLDDGGVMSRSGGRNIDMSERINVIGSGSKGRADASDTLMYVVNYADNAGFAIISAVRDAPELIAVTESGNFNSEKVQSNPGLQLYLTDAKEILSEQAANPLYKNDSVWVYDPRQPATQEKTVVDTVWIKKIPRRVLVKWNQDEPYNMECPYDVSSSKNCYAGCAPIAMAQIISTFKYPKTITVEYKNPSFHITYDINWDKICSIPWHFKDDVCDSDNSYPTHLRLAQIIRQIGEWGECDYGVDGSGMDKSMYNYVMHKKLGYQVEPLAGVQQYSLSNHLIYSDSYQTILLVRGNDNIDGSGHVWVCDASKRFKIRSRHYVKEGRFGDWEVKYTDYGPEVCLNYFNWGWGGAGNGYYADLDFDSKFNGNYSVTKQYMVIKWFQ